MIRFYPLFVIDKSLLVSPYLHEFNVLRGTTIERGKTETVNFLIQTKLNAEQCKKLSVIYDKLDLTIDSIEVNPFRYQSIISVKLKAKEIGSIKIGFEIPDLKPNPRLSLKKINLPLLKIPYLKLKAKPQ